MWVLPLGVLAGASLKRSVTCTHHVGSLRLPRTAGTNAIRTPPIARLPNNNKS